MKATFMYGAGDVPAGYAAMDARESLKVMITFCRRQHPMTTRRV